MKRTMLSVLILTALLAFLCGAALAEPWAGSGTEADPWCISSAADLVAFRDYVATEGFSEDMYFLLCNDINLSEYCSPTAGSWAPIKPSGYFNGTFDGGGHVISGLYINTSDDDQGLFGQTWADSTGTVKNLNVSGSVTGGNNTGGIVAVTGFKIMNCSFRGSMTGINMVGGITGYLGDGARLENCNFIGDVTGTGEYVGGIAGYAHTDAYINSCEVSGNISGTNYVGGIAGINYEGTIQNCVYQSGTVTGNEWVGGIAGLGNAPIEDCSSEGTIHGTLRVGGIAGENCASIKNCINHGKVSAPSYAGGITGHNFSGLGYQGIIENCKNYGNVTVDDSRAGGIVGYAQEPIIGCENHGKVQGRIYIGGIVGDTLSTVSFCKNDGQVVGEGLTGNIVGYGTQGVNFILKSNDGSDAEMNDSFYTIPACPFSNGSYSFFAWNTASDGSGTYYFENDGLPLVNEMTLYAIWMKSRSDGMFELHGGIAGLPGGHYVVSENVTLSERLMLSGNVNLLLENGTTLNATKGINVPAGSSLTVRAQGTGVLNATGAAHCAGIGGGNGESGGTITINGGVINATGGQYGAGIGGGDEGAGGDVTVNGGIVTACGTDGAAGIGGGDYGKGGTYTIYGGSVTAIGSIRSKTGQAAPGIGSGRPKGSHRDENFWGGQACFFGGTTVARSGGTDSVLGAYAVGVNYLDFSKSAEVYGDSKEGFWLILDQGMAFTPAGASEPVLADVRNQALMSGEVTVAPCRHPGQGATSNCIYCEKNVHFGAYLSSYERGFLIENPKDWENFVSLVNDTGLSTEDLTFALMDSMSVSAMVGTPDNPFRGTFDGNRRTLTVNLMASSSGKGPFAYARDAAFERVRVEGTITTDVDDTGGLVGHAEGECTITNCVSNVQIVSANASGHAGFVGSIDGNVAIVGSAFTGSITGTNVRYSSGFAGRGTGTADDCVYDGLISGGTDNNNNTFLRMKDRAENCYYTNIDGIDRIKGRQAFAVTADAGVTVDFGKPEGTYSISGITAYPTGLVYNGVFYAGEGQAVTLSLSGAYAYCVSAGTLRHTDGVWTLVMPAGDVVISAAPIFGDPDFILPAGLTTVEEGAFEGIAASVIDVPESCTGIGDGAFRNCPSLTRIRIPAGCNLGEDVFDGCEFVYVYGVAGSSAESYCNDPTHGNCLFVTE